ncbi:MAG: KH domain-containing protein [Terriglobia bacterium]|nr:KH domain-containing protein [Terriglobia bacterium]
MPGDVRMLVEHLAKNLVEAPDAVFVDVYEEDGGVEIELEVAEEDMGRVIGRSGRTARCLRTIINAAGQRADKRYSLDILD